MGQVIYCYTLAIVFLMNIGEVQSPFLVAVDWLAALFFVGIGSFAGWQNARR